MSTIVIELAFARLAGCWINLAKFDLLIVVVTACLRYKRTFVGDVLGFAALPIALVTHGTHDAEPLCTASEAANKRGRTLVLAASYLYSFA